MNSMSRKYYDPCKKDNYRKEEEEKCPTIIKCGCPSTVTLPVVSVGLAPATVTLASLTLDTSCICDPIIKLNFTSAFTTTLTAVLGAVSIQIFKQCKGQVTPVPVGPSWPVVSLVAAGALTGTLFTSFFICDSDSCNDDCCTYTAVATVSAAVAVAVVGATFNNSTLAAEVTCRSNECQKKCKKDHDKY